MRASQPSNSPVAWRWRGDVSAKRPRQEPVKGPRTEEERSALAGRAVYTGSSEHKNRKWWGGEPRSGQRQKRQKTTICPLAREDERDAATNWVREAIKRGQYEFFEGDKDFPKHIWYEADGVGWFGFCINSILGEYKGWPLEEDERRALFR